MKNRIGLFAVNLFVAAVLVCGTGAIRAASGSNAPIVIVTDSDFQSCGCVTGGSGSTADPYVIGPLAINKTAGASAAVSIDGTLLTKSFSLFNLTIAGNGTDSSIGILLNHINPSGSPKIAAQVSGTQRPSRATASELSWRIPVL